MVKSSRTVIEIHDELHGQLKRLALLNNLRIHEVADAAVADFLQDPERIKAVIRKLRPRSLPQDPALEQPQIHSPRAFWTQPAHTFSQFLHQHQ